MSKQKIIVVTNCKGGTGKSTLSAYLSTWINLNLKGSVLLTDSDPQQTIGRIKHMQTKKGHATPFEIKEFISASPSKWRAYLEVNKDYDYHVIDTIGDLGGPDRVYLLGHENSSVLIPFVMTEIDVPVVMSLLEDLEAIIGDKKKAVIGVINRAKRTTEQKHADILEGIAGMKIAGKLNESIRYTRDLRFDQMPKDEKLNNLLESIMKAI